MTDLSNNARVLLGSSFMNPKSTIFYGLVQTIPSPEAMAAIEELEAADILEREDQPGGGFRLSLTLDGKVMDRRPPGDTPEQMFEFIQNNPITLNIPNPDYTGRPGEWKR